MNSGSTQTSDQYSTISASSNDSKNKISSILASENSNHNNKTNYTFLVLRKCFKNNGGVSLMD